MLEEEYRAAVVVAHSQQRFSIWRESNLPWGAF
jgi:uncharacterized protein YbdZ (MbtH family)